jgi:hypothetical protein
MDCRYWLSPLAQCLSPLWRFSARSTTSIQCPTQSLVVFTRAGHIGTLTTTPIADASTVDCSASYEAQAKESPKPRSGLNEAFRGSRHDQEEEERESSDKQSWVGNGPVWIG